MELQHGRKYFWIGLSFFLCFGLGLVFFLTDTPSPPVKPGITQDTTQIDVAYQEFLAAEKHYQMAIAELDQALSSQDGQLSPELEAEFKMNLELIETSIQECRTILKENPDSQIVRDSLVELYKKKIDMLSEEWNFTAEVKNWGKFFYWLWSL